MATVLLLFEGLHPLVYQWFKCLVVCWFFILVVAVDPSCFIFFWRIVGVTAFWLLDYVWIVGWLWSNPQADTQHFDLLYRNGLCCSQRDPILL
jgi:hypothetical protein